MARTTLILFFVGFNSVLAHGQNKVYYLGNSALATLNNSCEISILSKQRDVIDYRQVLVHDVFDTLAMWHVEQIELTPGINTLDSILLSNIVLIDGDAHDYLLNKGLPPGRSQIFYTILDHDEEGGQVKLEIPYMTKDSTEIITETSEFFIKGRIPPSGTVMYSIGQNNKAYMATLWKNNFTIPAVPSLQVWISDSLYGIECYRDTLFRGAKLAKTKNFNELPTNEIPEKERFDFYQKQKPFSLNASIGLETRISSTDTLYDLVPANFSRLHVRPEIQVLGLPFSSELFFSTESGFGYNMNSFGISFDKNAYDGKLDELITQRQGAVNNEFNSMIYERQLLDEQLANHLDFQSILKSAIDSLDNYLGAETALVNSLQQNFDSKSQELKDSMSKRSGLDSLQSNYAVPRTRIIKHRDSLNKVYDQVETLVEDLNKKRSDMISAKDTLPSLTSNPLSGYNKYEVLGLLPKYVSLADHLDYFEVGKHFNKSLQPVLGFLPINGVSTGIRMGNYRFDGSFGRYATFGNLVSSRPYKDIPGRIASAWLGYQTSKERYIKGGFVALTENPEVVHQYLSTMQFGYEFKRVSAMGEFAGSLTSLAIQPLLRTSSIKTHLQYRFNGTSSFYLTNEMVGPNFSNANRFQLTNIWLRECGLSSSFLKNQIVASAFIKSQKNLFGHEISFNNTGYGFNLTAQFKKLPMLMISYMPFSQRIDGIAGQLYAVNQSSVINAFIRHSIRTQNTSNILSGSFLQSTNELASTGFAYTNSQLLINYHFQYKRAVSINSNIGIGYANSDTSTRYTLLGLNFTYQMGEKMSLQGRYSRNISAINLNTLSSYSLGAEIKVLKKGVIRLSSGYRELGDTDFELTQTITKEWFCELGMYLRI